MKHTHYQMRIAGLALIFMALSSCIDKEACEKVGMADGQAIIAYVDEIPETRVCVDPATSSTSGKIYYYWTPEDEIGVFTDASENNVQYLNTETEANVKVVTFAPTANVTGTPTYAYFPYSAEAGSDITSLNGNIPSEQSINSALDNVPGMYRYGYYKSSTDGEATFGFKHMFSTIRWRIDLAGTALEGRKLHSVEITVKRGTQDVPVCGDFTFNAETGNYTAGANTSNKVTITFEGQPVLDSDVTFYTTMLPNVKKNDLLYFTVNTVGYTATYKLRSNVGFKKNYVYTYSMPVKNYSGVGIKTNDITEVETPVDPETPVEPEVISGTFKCATYNVKSATSGTIGTYITNDSWDFFGLSEDFGNISSNLGNYSFGKRTSSALSGDADGLGFATKTATCSFSGEYIDAFDEEYGGLFDGANTVISKGFRYYLVTLADGVQIDVYITHMNTYDTEEHKACQHAQLKELATWIANHRNGRPVIFMGDTNCRYTRHDFETYFWSIIRAEGITYNDPWVDFQWDGVYPELGSKSLMVSDATGTNSETDIICSTTQNGEVVDKIIYINDANADTQIKATSYLRDMDYSGLSDHMPIVVEFYYEKTN